ncbi:hypothetical protein GDO78_016278 [Eleutherodactylus coqui]|uniref:Uncharacterized protein n=1 Tax=Eleutherodactylus coqui TaxID=57060 RepID=A0A8J6E650_ELECQ|nr:hypothetical protein GDO78_016278 [Eleutherodactylus coqui]
MLSEVTSFIVGRGYMPSKVIGTGYVLSDVKGSSEGIDYAH